MKKLNLTLLFCLLSMLIFAQDKLYTTNKKVINAQVIEIGKKEVKYRIYNGSINLDLTIDRDDLNLIILKNGTEYEIKHNIRHDRPFGVSVNALGPTMNILGSISFDYFIIPQLNLEAGLNGIDYYSGIKLFPVGHKKYRKLSPYIGATFCYCPEFNGGYTDYSGYIPLGIQYISKFGLSASAELAGVIDKDNYMPPFFIGFRIGYHFSR